MRTLLAQQRSRPVYDTRLVSNVLLQRSLKQYTRILSSKRHGTWQAVYLNSLLLISDFTGTERFNRLENAATNKRSLWDVSYLASAPYTRCPKYKCVLQVYILLSTDTKHVDNNLLNYPKIDCRRSQNIGWVCCSKKC